MSEYNARRQQRIDRERGLQEIQEEMNFVNVASRPDNYGNGKKGGVTNNINDSPAKSTQEPHV